jgi:hypothetical protein
VVGSRQSVLCGKRLCECVVLVRWQAETGVYSMQVPPTSYWMLAGSNYCLGLASVPGISVVMGDVVMENYYFAHDKGNMKVGVAPRSAADC